MIFARRDIYTACSDWQARVRQEEVPLLVPRHRADDRCASSPAAPEKGGCSCAHPVELGPAGATACARPASRKSK